MQAAVQDAKRQFEELARRAGRDVPTLAPAEGVALMRAFYDEVRFGGLVDEPCADMLLYQYGTYDFGEGEEFLYDLTRQLVVPEADGQELWQLSLRWTFAPTEALRALGEVERFCDRREEAPAFGASFERCPAYAAVGGAKPIKVSLRFEQAE